MRNFPVCACLVMMIVAMLPAGCASSPKTASIRSGARPGELPGAGDPFAGAPEDFQLDLTVQPAPGKGRAPQGAARFIVLSDGALYYGADVYRGAGQMPLKVRTLSHRELASLWALLQHLGFTEREAGGEPINTDLVSPLSDGSVQHIVNITAESQSWSFLRTGAGEDPAMRQLIDRLAQLAWVEDELGRRVTVMPRRYDFGDDPYAPYREP